MTYFEKVNTQIFAIKLNEAKRIKPSLKTNQLSIVELCLMDTYLASDGNAGFAITEDNELLSMFNLGTNNNDLVRAACDKGARVVETDDIKLFERHGFHSKNGQMVLDKDQYLEQRGLRLKGQKRRTGKHG